VTALGESTRPILRSTAREGDLIVVTGSLGRSAAGLAVLERGAPAGLSADALADVTGAHLRPMPRVREGLWLADAGDVTAMIDVSDGLATDLAHLAEESGVGARVDVARIPVNDSTRQVATAFDGDPFAWATGGGEDYELLLTCPASALTRLSEGLDRATGGGRLHAIGEIVGRPDGVEFVDATGRPVAIEAGFQHFRHRPARVSR
jgi:thiamine-monophosphate kinase